MALLPTARTKPLINFRGKLGVLYGPPGTGKTTAMNQLGALHFDTQKGTKALEAFVVPITSWMDALRAQHELLTTVNQFDVISIDLANDLFKMLEMHICAEHKVQQLNDLAYGKGAAIFKDHLYKFILNFLKSEKTVFFIAHSKEKTQTTKTTTVTVMQSSLTPAAQDLLFGLADFVLYCYVSSENKRLMRTKPGRNVEAKDRFGLAPETMPFDMVAFRKLFERELQVVPTK